MRTLQSLSLCAPGRADANTLGERGTRALAALARAGLLSGLRKLELQRECPAGFPFAALPALRELDLSRSDVAELGDEWPVRLEILRLRRCGLLRRLAALPPALKVLDVAFAPLEALPLPLPASLRSLGVEGCVQLQGLAEALACVPDLRLLDAGPPAPPHIVEALRASPPVALEELWLEKAALPVALLSQLSRLRVLHNGEPLGLRALAEAMPASVEELVLHDRPREAEAEEEWLAQALRRAPRLREAHIGGRGGDLLCAQIVHCGQLRVLDVSFATLGAGAGAMLAAMPALEELDATNVQGLEWAHLGEAVAGGGMARLRRLVLSDADLTGPGPDVGVLAAMSSLRRLLLDGVSELQRLPDLPPRLERLNIRGSAVEALPAAPRLRLLLANHSRLRALPPEAPRLKVARVVGTPLSRDAGRGVLVLG